MKKITIDSKLIKKIISIVAICLLFVTTYLLDKLIPSTSKMKMLVTVIEKSAIYALVAVSMNLLNGFTGLFSLGQAGFMMIGAYTYAIFSIASASHDKVYQYYDGGAIKWSLVEIFEKAFAFMGTFGTQFGHYFAIIILICLAGLIAGLIAFLIGIPVLRLKSDYLAIASLGFAEILRAFFQWDSLGSITNGSNVLRKYAVYNNTIFPVIISTICIAIIMLLIKSSYGRAFKSIRDDEIAAEAMGIDLFKHKEMSFVISSFFAGVGGALLAMFQNTISATPFTSTMTYEILLIVVVGGIGSVTGSIIASFLFIACSEWWLRGLDSGTFLGITSSLFKSGFRKVVFALIIVLIVLFFAKGIMGTKEFSWDGIFNWFKNLPKNIKNIPANIKAKRQKRAEIKAILKAEKAEHDALLKGEKKNSVSFVPLDLPNEVVVFDTANKNKAGE